MQSNQPRRIAILSLAYTATLVLQVGSRLLSDRDQDTVEAIYAAISSHFVWHAVYSLSVMAAAVLLVAVVANWNRWRETRPTLLDRIAFWIVLAAGTCWLVGGLTTMLQTLAAPAIMAGNLAPLSPAGLEEVRALFGKLGMSLSGTAILLVGAGNPAVRPGRHRHVAGRGGIGCGRSRNLVGGSAFPPPSGNTLFGLVCRRRPDSAPVWPFRPQARLTTGYRPHSFRSSSMVRSGPFSP